MAVLTQVPYLSKLRVVQEGGIEGYLLPHSQNAQLLSETSSWEERRGKTRSQVLNIKDFGTGIPLPSAIIPQSARIDSHPLGHFVRGILNNTVDLGSLWETLAPSLHASFVGNGIIPAATSNYTDYLGSTWPRDNAYVLRAALIAGDKALAQSIIYTNLEYYCRHYQRGSLVQAHLDPQTYARNSKNLSLHARIDIDFESQNLIPRKHGWNDEQYDAPGSILWIAGLAANEGLLNLSDIDANLTKVHPANGSESIFSLMVKFFNRVEAWNQHGFGAWEFVKEKSRLSEAVPMLAGVQQIRRLVEESRKKGVLPFAIDYKDATNSDQKCHWLCNELETLAFELWKVVNKRIPNQPNAECVECDGENGERFKQDSAVLFSLYPYDIGLDYHQELAVLRTVYKNIREYGFRRFPKDEYVGEGYASNSVAFGVFSDTKVEGYREAEWPLFDAMFSGFYLRRAVSTETFDPLAAEYGRVHLARSILAIAPHIYKFERNIEGQPKVEVPAGSFPEAYWFDTATNTMKPNHNFDLQMYKAFLSLSLQRYAFALPSMRAHSRQAA